MVEKVAPSAAGITSVTATVMGAKPTESAKQAPALAHQVVGRRRRLQVVCLVHHVHLARGQKIRQPIYKQHSTAAANGPAPSPTFGLILVCIGAAITLVCLFVAHNSLSLGGAILLGAAFGLGVALIVTGLLCSLFSYLLALYEKRRMARVDKREK